MGYADGIGLVVRSSWKALDGLESKTQRHESLADLFGLAASLKALLVLGCTGSASHEMLMSGDFSAEAVLVKNLVSMTA